MKKNTKTKKITIITLIILSFIINSIASFSYSENNENKKLQNKSYQLEDLLNLRVLIDKIEIKDVSLSIKGSNISLKYSTEEFPTIYQGGFSLANQITILSLHPYLKFFYDQNYYDEKNIPNYKDIMILSSNYLEYKNKKYRGKFLITKKNDGYYLINLVSMDDYLKSVVPSEMPASWELEALKAQAIIARTYAIRVTIERRKKQEIFDLYSTVLDQAYYGMDKENPKTNLAVEQTKDIIIIHNNKPIWALYHSNCGGKTIEGKLVFSNRLEENENYLQSINCPFEGRRWKNIIELYTLKKILEKTTKNQIYSINKIYTENFRIYIVYNQNYIYSLPNWQLRKLIGYNVIRSPYITKIEILQDKVIFEGIGAGHGVGLCQFGANTLAKMNFNYEEIIKYYYKEIQLTDIKRWLENANI